MTAFCISAIMPAFASTPYDDVPLDHWAYDAVKTLTADGIIEGYPDGTFKGDKPITRFEMAKMIKEAVVREDEIHDKDRKLLDKLANEYKEELKGFNVRIVELERKVGNVRWKGNIRYRYINDHTTSNDGGGFMAMFGGGGGGVTRNKSSLQYITATLEPDIKIADHWTGHLRMNYNIDTTSGGNSTNDTFGGSNNGGGIMAMFGGGGSTGRKVKEFNVDRVYLHGDYKNLDINLGRLPYTSFIDKGMVFNDSVTGGQVIYGSKIKGAITAGRISNDPYKVKENDGGMFAMFGMGGNIEQKTNYVGAEVFVTPGKANIGVGYHYFGNRNFEDNGGGFMAMFGGGGENEKQSANIFSVGAGYQFDKIFCLNGAVAWNTKDDMGYDGSKRAWQIETTLGKKDLDKAGNLSGYIAYRHLGNSVAWRPDYEVMNAGQKGFDAGVNYVIAKNVLASLRYFRGKSIKTKENENTLFGEVYCYF